MSRPKSDALTGREAQVMEVLWSHGNVTADKIRDLLPDRPHDSSVRTILRILETKRYVARVGPGRPLVYEPVVSRAKAQRTALRGILGRLFGGSPEALALRLLEDRHLTPEQFEEIARSVLPSTESRKQAPFTSKNRDGDPDNHDYGEPR